MRITRCQLRQIIKEAMDPVRVKTLPPEDFDPPVWSDATEPRSSEIPQKKVGNFFMTRASDGMPSRGYGTLKKLKNFYLMVRHFVLALFLETQDLALSKLRMA